MPNGNDFDHRSNGSNGRRSTDYNPKWCDERHDKQDAKLAEIWGEEHGGIKALWNKVGSIDRKLWAIIVGQVAIMGGIIVAMIRISLG